MKSDTLPYRLVRSVRKSVGLSVDASGALIVRAPKTLPLHVIEAVIRSHQDWIRAQQARISAASAFSLSDGALLPLYGIEHRVEYADCASIHVEEGRLLLPFGTTEPELVAWLKAQLLETITKRIDWYAPQMQVQPAGIRVTNARSRWGSCSPVSRLCFSVHLVFCAAEAIDYVVVHELAHIVQKNHSAAFHELVRSVFPEEKQWRTYLRDHAQVLQLL